MRKGIAKVLAGSLLFGSLMGSVPAAASEPASMEEMLAEISQITSMQFEETMNMQMENGDITVYMSGMAGEGSLSDVDVMMTISVPEEAVELEIALEDIVRMTEGVCYFNIGEVLNFVSEMAGDASVAQIIQMFGITEPWVAINIDEVVPFTGEATTALLVDITEKFTEGVTLPEATAVEGGFQISYDAETYAAFMETYAQVLADNMVSWIDSGLDIVRDFDVVDYVGGYIDAVGAGIVQIQPDFDVEAMKSEIMQGFNVEEYQAALAQMSGEAVVAAMEEEGVTLEQLPELMKALVAEQGASSNVYTITKEGDSYQAVINGESTVTITLDGVEDVQTATVEACVLVTPVDEVSVEVPTDCIELKELITKVSATVYALYSVSAGYGEVE